MGEVSSDTAEQIGERLADALVEQCCDLGGSLTEARANLLEAVCVIRERVNVERRVTVEELREIGWAEDTFICIAKHGYVWDGNVPSKEGRNALVGQGLIQRGHGYQWLTEGGVRLALDMKLLKD